LPTDAEVRGPGRARGDAYMADEDDDIADESEEARQSLIMSFIIDDEDASDEDGCR